MSVPMRRVVHEWPANDAGRRAAELAYARGQLVHAERHGDVVRVVLRVPAGRATRVRQRATGRPWLVPAVVIGGAVTAVGVLVLLLRWVVLWLADHAAQVLGVLGALLVVMYLLGRVGACPGVHCPGCRHS